MLLENIGTSVLVGPEQLPSLHRLLLTAARTLQMDPPDLYIKQVPATCTNYFHTHADKVWDDNTVHVVARLPRHTPAWGLLHCFPQQCHDKCVSITTTVLLDESPRPDKDALVQNPVPNAYTLAIGGRKPFVVVHTALLELLEPLEVQVRIPLPPCLCLLLT